MFSILLRVIYVTAVVFLSDEALPVATLSASKNILDPKLPGLRTTFTELMSLNYWSPVSVLFQSTSSEEKVSPSCPFPMERVVSTGPEDAIETTLVVFVDEVWTSTSLYVTIFQSSDFIVKVPSTHSSIVLNSLSSSVEDLSCLAYICVVVYVYCLRGWIIPSFYCSEEV
ncbi:hypothetical protein F2Q70_00041593 [Brassica cretica]|uniref:Uncharacterized protein n=1 Tax=Brassica cretica TaxID=69181 RepID=A0A8S9KDJ4_BRACR|nr:hypothetical protein F2Q70_00041593 [Brassica cretica]